MIVELEVNHDAQRFRYRSESDVHHEVREAELSDLGNELARGMAALGLSPQHFFLVMHIALVNVCNSRHWCLGRIEVAMSVAISEALTTSSSVCEWQLEEAIAGIDRTIEHLRDAKRRVEAVLGGAE